MTAGLPETPDVTVVVITRNRWPDLRESLPRHRCPVILLDNGSEDGTPAHVRASFPDIDVIELGSNFGAVARNMGVERATTPYVAFADDDSWWSPGALSSAALTLDSYPRLAVLAARVLVGKDERPDPLCAAMEASPLGTEPDLPGPSVLGFLACGAIVRRDAFLAAGGFDEVVFFGGEEERLALDLASQGLGLAYVDDVVARHRPSPGRDRAERLARGERNRLLTAVMRRPWPVVARQMLRAMRQGDPGLRGVLRAVPALPRALRARRPVDRQVEAARRLVDTAPSLGAASRRPGSPYARARSQAGTADP
ncbi:glycosyltransferase [Nocardioides sp.]|uniref:glycosyltransferase family 2 protein n=1 Tax=Nocardioides sp. TaxID=35761 RepID=UPI0019A9A0AC|nr:glycosyltransferase [Nocardioides sp.]MBC7278822.1 glycosyltransferase [Nocardioides sp.]